MARFLHLDIETIPAQSEAIKSFIFNKPKYMQLTAIPPIKVNASYKDPAKIEADIADRTEKAKQQLAADNAEKLVAADVEWRQTALDAWCGHVAVVGWALDDEPVQMLRTIEANPYRVLVARGCVRPPNYCGPDGTDEWASGIDVDAGIERDVLTVFLYGVEGQLRVIGGHPESLVVVGHNIRRFDLMFLWIRCIVLGIKPPLWLREARHSPKYSDEFVNDTIEMAGSSCGKQFGHSLDHLCRALNIPGKGDITGAGVWDAILAGRLDEVEDYCGDDVRRSRSVWRRLLLGRPLAVDMEQMLPTTTGDAA